MRSIIDDLKKVVRDSKYKNLEMVDKSLGTEYICIEMRGIVYFVENKNNDYSKIKLTYDLLVPTSYKSFIIFSFFLSGCRSNVFFVSEFCPPIFDRHRRISVIDESIEDNI